MTRRRCFAIMRAPFMTCAFGTSGKGKPYGVV
jgi:hypothetical protein